MTDWVEMLNADVLTLGMAADEARRAALPTNVVTYTRVHEIDALAGTGGELPIPPAASEVRITGISPTFEDAIALVRTVKERAGTRLIAAFAFADLEHRGWATASHLSDLGAAGAADVAELAVDHIADLDAALRSLTAAGLRPRRLTVAHPLAGDRVGVLRRVQHAFEAWDTLRRFSPLQRVAPLDKPTTGYDDVRMVALSRLALRSASIEVNWRLYGPKLAQVALTFGADHLDAVSPLDEPSLGPRRATVEDVERNIRAAGFEPKEAPAS